MAIVKFVGNLHSKKIPVPQSISEAERLEIAEDKASEREYQKKLAYCQSLVDPVTKYLMKAKNMALTPYNKYTRGDFPLDEHGYHYVVEKWYPSLNLIVDKIPYRWTSEKILSKKWLIEQMGFEYTYIIDGEELTDEDEFWKRAKPLEKEPVHPKKSNHLLDNCR